MQNIWERKAFKIQGDKKVVYTTSLLASTPLFVTNRCCYVQRDATLLKYPLNSRIKQSKWKRWNLFKVMKEYKHWNRKYIISVRYLNQMNSKNQVAMNQISKILSEVAVFSRHNFLPHSTHFSLYGEEKSCNQFLQHTHSIQSSSFVVWT
jgi:hypothetical protein